MLVINRIGQGKVKKVILRVKEVIVVMVDNTERIYEWSATKERTKGGTK